MLGAETTAGWRLLKLNWILIACLALTLTGTLGATDFYLEGESATLPPRFTRAWPIATC